jgi:iron complex outermembrane recepter protein
VQKSNKTASSRFMLGVSAMALLAVVGVTGTANAQNGEGTETVVVTGYRASLEKAMDLKRSALDASDSILAEDIGKFPDMNVSEALQRIPGVAINREAGEGREITVRGLGAQFTRVRVNGIEAVATVGSQDVSSSNPGGGAGGTNRGRAFDFNVFASELFSALTVHKSNSASIEEGSLGATVDLRTARPFDHEGLVITGSAQAQYQSMAGSVTPRVAALVSNTFAGGKLGILFSAAYQGTNTLEEGHSSVRWMSDMNNTAAPSANYIFGSVPSGASSITSPENTAFHPRFPRYDIVTTHSKRLGLTGAVQWQPDDHTLFSVDALYADFGQVRNENYLEGNAFSTSAYGSKTTYMDGTTQHFVVSQGIRSIQLLSATMGSATGMDMNHNVTQTMIAASATNVGLRNEHRLDHLDTRFMQATVDGTHDFSDKFRAHVLLGWTESHHRNPVQATLAADLGLNGIGAGPATPTATTPLNWNGGAGTTANPYKYDYSLGSIPLLSTGNIDPASTAGWFLANVRERQQFAFNSYRSAALDFEWQAHPEVKINGGFDFRNYGFGTYETRRSTGGTGEDSTIPAAVRAVPLSNYSKVVSFEGVHAPAGSNTSWFVADLDKAGSAIGLWDSSVFPLNRAPGISNSGGVRENDYGGWLQATWDSQLLGMPFRGDTGIRYVLTESNSTGWTVASTGISPVAAHIVYHDWLPSMNVILAPFEDFQVRFNASYAMSRPTQSSMMPSGAPSVSGSSFAVSVGNPYLQPMRSKNLDLAFEWYYGKGSMLSVAGFWKHLDNFFQSAQSSGIWSTNPFGFDAAPFVSACGGTGTNWASIPTSSNCYTNGANQTWTFTRTVSVKGAPLYGTEINWQQQLYFLPQPFDNMGVLANYTYVQAQQSFYSNTAQFLMKADLNNMSRNSYNATVYYDDSIFQARVTAAFRSHYLVDANIQTNYQNFGIFTKSTLNVDASLSYKWNENYMFTVDALNLTNQASNIYADQYAQRSYQYHQTGRVYFFGIKYTY